MLTPSKSASFKAQPKFVVFDSSGLQRRQERKVAESRRVPCAALTNTQAPLPPLYINGV